MLLVRGVVNGFVEAKAVDPPLGAPLRKKAVIKPKKKNHPLARPVVGRCNDAPSERPATEALLHSVDLVEARQLKQGGWLYSHGVTDHSGAATRQHLDGIDGVWSTAL